MILPEPLQQVWLIKWFLLNRGKVTAVDTIQFTQFKIISNLLNLTALHWLYMIKTYLANHYWYHINMFKGVNLQPFFEANSWNVHFGYIAFNNFDSNYFYNYYLKWHAWISNCVYISAVVSVTRFFIRKDFVHEDQQMIRWPA